MQAIQDFIPNNQCFGCGPSNISGLQIKSIWVNDAHNETECRYTPLAHQCAGPTHIVNGGVIATLVDCHCVCTAIAKGYLVEGRSIGEGDPIWFATGKLTVNFQRPALMIHELVLKAQIIDVKEKKITLACDVWSNDECVVRAEVIAVKVPNKWFEGS